ncbi:Protein of unknown function [Paenimyroides ummariense]|uniref:DUF3822 domain-containing protein n=1 Tax=Paenimyroides ummariense TaxID=913024 RepID=A0A1I5AIR8_9FLAO|nr:DUF3822 family protein [Paenimyroides ummariense]SFN62374.1 Protein of unknown function [Paenimyroides ummariense]
MTNESFQKLYIQVSLQNFSYCVKNQVNNQVIQFKSFALDQYKTIEQQLDVFFDKEEALQTGFSDVLVLHDNNLNTFVPTALFDETALGSYLQYNTKVFPTDYFDFDSLTQHQMENIYVPYVAFNNYFLDVFGSFNFQHINTGLVQHFLNKSANNNQVEFFVHVADTHFEVVLLQNKKLLLFNSYEYQTQEDFIYYLLFVFEQLQLDPQKQLVKIVGNCTKESNLYQITYKFIRNVEVADLKTIAQTLSVTNEQLQQHYILLHA